MLTAASTPRVFIVLGATDMRKAINGLSILVADHLEEDIFSGSLFVFCNRSRTIIKTLYWDRNGFCLWQKRLEKHRFAWPKSREESWRWTTADFAGFWTALIPSRLSATPLWRTKI